MVPHSMAEMIARQPAAVVMAAVVAVLLMATITLSVAIRRRERPLAVAVVPADETVEVGRIQRATAAAMPDTIKERLRFLANEASLGTGAVSAPPTASGGASSDVADYFFGADLPGRATESDGDRTAHFMPDEMASGDDATQFFSVESESSDAETTFDATHFFGDDLLAAPSRGETQFFGSSDLDDESDLHRSPEDPTSMLQALPPSFEAAFSRKPALPNWSEEEWRADNVATADDGDSSTIDRSDAVFAPPSAFIGTGPLAALPSSASSVAKPSVNDGPVRVPPLAQGDLDEVARCLTAVDEPEVLALSVINTSGDIVAGETDEGLVGELRSLLSEMTISDDRSIEQPVTLGDDSMGLLLLIPTGSNLLLGALVRDEGNGETTRQRLHRVAYDIGEALQRAS